MRFKSLRRYLSKSISHFSILLASKNRFILRLSMGISNHRTEQCLENTAGGIRVLNWMFPSTFYYYAENNFVVFGVIAGAVFLQCSAQCRIVVLFAHIIHNTKLRPPNTQQQFWIFCLMIDVEARTCDSYNFLLFEL